MIFKLNWEIICALLRSKILVNWFVWSLFHYEIHVTKGYVSNIKYYVQFTLNIFITQKIHIWGTFEGKCLNEWNFCNSSILDRIFRSCELPYAHEIQNMFSRSIMVSWRDENIFQQDHTVISLLFVQKSLKN